MEKLQKKLIKLSAQLSLLYVEDDDLTRKQYDDIFKLLFKDVKCVVNGEEALKEYKSKQYDLVITDLTMPKMDGITMIGEIVKINPLQKIIVMTAHNSNNSLMDSINFHVDGFLLKPVSMDNLLNLLFKVCENIYYKNININKTISENIDASKAFFIVVIDNFYDITSRFNSSIKKSIYKYVSEYLSNLGIQDAVIMNEHTDVFLCSIDKNKLDRTLKVLQKYSHNYNYVVLERKRIKVYITLSYGVILLKDIPNKTSTNKIIEHIDSLIYEIKQDEDSSSVVKMDINYEEAKKNESLNWLQLTLDALDKNSIIPFYQPIFDINTLNISSYQILARIKNKSDYILPKYFIDLSKKAGILENITKAILELSCKEFSNNKYPFHIDIVDVVWRDENIEDYLNNLCEHYNIKKDRIILDIQNYNSMKVLCEKTTTILNLKKLGYKIALKDFRTNNINIELISLLKPDYIKINKLVLHNSQNDYHLKKAIEFLLDYINTTGIKCILVGVEGQETIDIAKNNGFNFLQGFYIARPSKSLYSKEKLSAISFDIDNGEHR